MFAWHSTAHLEVDHDGDLWLIVPDDDGDRARRRLGALLHDPPLPPELEPERDELLDLWRDAHRCDERREWEATYYAGLL